ncbi:MAG: hypothetical protein AAB597_01300 [Patescibacteria group bacterium]
MEQEPKGEWSESDALIQISAIEGEIRQMGAVDSEVDYLNRIRESLRTKNITPIQAIELAEEVRNKKMGYH